METHPINKHLPITVQTLEAYNSSRLLSTDIISGKEFRRLRRNNKNFKNNKNV